MRVLEFEIRVFSFFFLHGDIDVAGCRNKIGIVQLCACDLPNLQRSSTFHCALRVVSDCALKPLCQRTNYRWVCGIKASTSRKTS